MTDKHIIIDGVDVSGCDFLAKKDDYCSYSGVTYAYKGQCMCSDEEMCKEHPKCFYKKVLKQLKRKEQEVDVLKAENRRLDNELYMTVEEGRAWYDLMERYEQALTEIKEIVQFGDRPYKLCGEYNECCDVLNEIWNKISEVEDEDTNN